MTFGAPVPAAMFETWNDVGWKNSLPLSQRLAARTSPVAEVAAEHGLEVGIVLQH